MLAAQLPDWANSENMKVITIGVIVVALVAMLLVLRFIQKLMLKMSLFALFGLIGVVAWVERADLSDCAKTCSCRVLWQDVKIPADKNPACAVKTPPAPK